VDFASSCVKSPLFARMKEEGNAAVTGSSYRRAALKQLSSVLILNFGDMTNSSLILRAAFTMASWYREGGRLQL
jgi:hypothetical protein